MNKLLSDAYRYYIENGGRICGNAEEFIYMITRRALMKIFNSIRRGRSLDIDLTDTLIVQTLCFGDKIDFSPIRGFEQIRMPSDILESIQLLNNVNFKGVK